MLLKIQGDKDQRLAALVNPEPTAQTKVRQAQRAIDRRRQHQAQQRGQELRAAEPSGRRGALWLPPSAQSRRSAFHLMPGLDAATLQAKYGAGQQQPTWRWGFFRVPLDVADYPATYQRMRNESVALFLKTMEAQGYRLLGRIQVHEGHYPAMALDSTGHYTVPELDKREFKVTAQFVVANPKPVAIPLDDELAQPLRLHH